ncbi:hypothetical protein [Desulfobotulus sp.]|jgi:hypothetical protein|uniref:hypothetical protein n=1 Tax=Desulfobotulus sp. TaxID=1940337 RepID=UPI002A363887|nr:hypothetical protein [Desulfobotulus sp.]MDY0162062.1 hypothetical protein [Desulfobotulus sp.]
MGKNRVVVFLFLILALGVCVSASAREQRGPGRPSAFPPALKFLMDRFAMDAIAVSVLADMTGENEEKLWERLDDGLVLDLLEDLDVDREAFREAMDLQVMERIRVAEKNGLLTREEAEKGAAFLRNRPEGPPKAGRPTP